MTDLAISASRAVLRGSPRVLSRVALQTSTRESYMLSRNMTTSFRLPLRILSVQGRPALHNHRVSLPITPKRSLFIQTESTPNPDALKFLPNTRILPPTLSSPFLEYLTPRSTLTPPHPSPLAARILNVDGVTSVFYGSDFITVSKNADTNWAYIKPELFALITEAVTAGESIVETRGMPTIPGEGQGPPMEEDSLNPSADDTEVVGMIKELLLTRIRPAIQEDGGDIEFRGFDKDTGEVSLKLRGACRTCDSSTVTLKNGIEGMLMHYVEEVKAVVQVLDQEEKVAEDEFRKFEERLRGERDRITA